MSYTNAFYVSGSRHALQKFAAQTFAPVKPGKVEPAKPPQPAAQPADARPATPIAPPPMSAAPAVPVATQSPAGAQTAGPILGTGVSPAATPATMGMTQPQVQLGQAPNIANDTASQGRADVIARQGGGK